MDIPGKTISKCGMNSFAEGTLPSAEATNVFLQGLIDVNASTGCFFHALAPSLMFIFS